MSTLGLNEDEQSLYYAAHSHLRRLGFNARVLGQDYFDFLRKKGEPRKIAFKLFGQEADVGALEFLCQRGLECFRASSQYSSKHVTIRYTVWHKYNEKKAPFFVGDLQAYFEDVIEISSIVNCSGEKGAGAEVLKEFCDLVGDRFPVILQAGFLLSGDYDKAQNSDDYSAVDKLVDFYSNNGFVNVNDKIGEYTESVIMMYNNRFYRMLTERVDKLDAF